MEEKEGDSSRIVLIELVSRHLTTEDDPALWNAVIEAIYTDAEYLCSFNPEGKVISTIIGCCSHWLRPHQTRWTADGGFAWPAGYGGDQYSRLGYPLHDWEVELWWSAEIGWKAEPPRASIPQRKRAQFRVSVPARSTRHRQAAVFTVWWPGSPPRPKAQLLQFYGFRQQGTAWSCTATSERKTAYELVGETS
jgi:hypothetical protein